MEFGKEIDWLITDPTADINQRKRELISDGREIFDLSMINPDILPSTFVLDKLHEFSIKPYNHRYSLSRGVKKLREAFAHKYRERFEVTVDPESEVSAAMGTKDAILHLLMCLCSPGDSVLVGRPTYPAYLSAIRLARLSPAWFDISSDENETLNAIASALDRTGARVLLLNFPNNPTGACVSSHFYSELSKIVDQRKVFIINDFVYGEMGFTSRQPSLLGEASLRTRACEVYSLSKAYSVPGWRVGAVVGDSGIVSLFAKLKAHSDYGIFLPLQLASAAVLTSKQDLVKPVVTQYNNRLKLLVRGLLALGWEISIPAAGASLWAPLPKPFAEMGSLDFVRDLLERTGIHLLPGQVYGESFAKFVRFALVISEEKVHEVVSRLGEYCAQKVGSAALASDIGSRPDTLLL